MIGAGIVGLHIATVLREQGHDVYVLEQSACLGEQTSGRNSGVIHAGIFYQPGSFKEQVCLAGNRLTYEWVQKLNVPHRPCGKWVVAEPGQEEMFESFFEKVRRMPLRAPQIKSADEVALEEPALRKTRAILIPSTGILDAASYIKSLARYLEERGVTVVLNCKVEGVSDDKIITSRGDMPFDLAINAAGLFADEIACMTGLSDFTIKPCRGDYYVMNQAPLKRPVYHLPYKDAKGLGVHLTPTVDGQTLIGPNAFFIEGKTDYEHKSSPENFQKAVAFYLPHFKAPKLQRAYSGNRPKLYKNGTPHPEFVVQKVKNWVHLLGIESPGLTAAPALARHVCDMV